MPTKITANQKAVLARQRKEQKKSDEKEKQIKEVEDAKWVDNDKIYANKMSRKNKKEEKKANDIIRKQNNKKMLDEEMNSIQGKGVVALSPRVTKKNIEDNVKKIGPAGSTTGQTIQYKKSSIVTSPTKPLVESDSDDENEFMADVPQNINRLDDDEIQVKGIDAAIYVLDRINVTEVDLEPKDRHPEKRRKAAFKIYKEEEMIRLKVEQPGLTFTQKEKMIFKSWQKSPDNPVYQSRISGPN